MSTTTPSAPASAPASTPTPGDRMNSSEGGSSDASEALTPCPSADSSVIRTPVKAPMPMSPPRSQNTVAHQQMVSSVPNSPAPPSIADRSPAVTPSQLPRPVNPFTQPEATGVVLGLEQLERQQDEAERRRQNQLIAPPATPVLPRRQPNSNSNSSNTSSSRVPQPPAASPSTVTVRRYLEDDENTALSSTLGSGTQSHAGDGSLGSGDDSDPHSQKESTKFGKIIKKTRKRLSSNDFLRRKGSGDGDDPALEDEDDEIDSLIYGHLQKLGRNGKWQTRWFETDGECLSYYKSSKRTKLLATLDLAKVGGIVVNEDDPKGCSFTMQVLGRPYYLRAESRAVCKDWVITLNRIKEARMQQGNIKLVNSNPKHLLFRNPPDLLDRNVSTYTQGVVALANRQRTRAVDESVMDNIEEMMLKGQAEPGDDEAEGPGYYEPADTDSISQVVLARWQKRKSSMSKIASKVSRWARSLKKYNCADEQQHVRLDRNVHPPGHANPKRPVKANTVERQRQQRAPEPQPGPGLSGWICKETSLAAEGGPVIMNTDESVEVTTDQAPISIQPTSVAPETGSATDDEETRELS